MGLAAKGIIWEGQARDLKRGVSATIKGIDVATQVEISRHAR
jgi:hypothetical protein